MPELPDSKFLNLLKSGFAEGIHSPQLLKAGKLRMFYDSGSIRQITSGENEVIRMIYSAVRDEYWETIEPSIIAEKISAYPDSFDISYTCLYKREEIEYEADYHIQGFPDGTVSFDMHGVAKSDFKKNRIGFCVLHPVKEYSGQPVIVEHPDKTITNAEFPELVSAHQPFKNIQSLKAYFSHKEYSVLNFTGDIFETEDQRNWTDGSYKTYCTPLEMPKPARLKQGDKIYQKIVLSTGGDGTASSPENVENQVVLISSDLEKTLKLPAIGICRSTRKQNINDEEINILREIPFKGYRVEIYISTDTWKESLAISAKESRALGYPLECALFLKNRCLEDLNQFITFISESDISPSVIYLFGSDCHCLEIEFVNECIKLLKPVFPEIKIGCGTNANFAQLNRERPDGAKSDFISFSVHPQEHAFDNRTLVENAGAQEYAVKSALAFTDGRPVSISPVTLKRRYNANKEYFENGFKDQNMLPQADPRQSSLFAACWTLASIKYLAGAGAKSIYYYETAGERGIIQGVHPPASQGNKHPVRGSIFPVYILFKFLLNLPQVNIFSTSSSSPFDVDALGIKSENDIYLLIFNFTENSKMINLTGIAKILDYIMIDVELYVNNMFNNEWLKKPGFTKLQYPDRFKLNALSIAVCRCV